MQKSKIKRGADDKTPGKIPKKQFHKQVRVFVDRERERKRDEMEKSTIQIEELDESDDFLLELAAIEAEAEAAASAAKRPKVAAVPEGPYMAALKGSKSEQWQLNPLNPASKSRGGFQGASVNSNPAGSYGSEAGEQDFPEKKCPCGNGVCSILTSNTQKNPGRKFYKCPNREVRSDAPRCSMKCR